MRRGLLLPALWVIAAVLACHAPPRPAAEAKPPNPLARRVTGANIAAVQDRRRGYGTATARKTLDRLRNLGVNTVSILMEGRMRNLADPEIRLPSTEEETAIQSALLDAHALGLATVLIPHIAIDDGAWRGDITLPDQRLRAKWWASYHAFVDVAARVATASGATMLAIGVELKGLSKTEEGRERMSALARDVRVPYKGLLTYAANWDEAEMVTFWDAIDLAGVNGYYPLLPDPKRGAETVGRRLEGLAQIAGREVIVLEVGYRSSPRPHLRPWEWPSQVVAEVDDAGQANAWAAVLSSWLTLEHVRGLLIWVVPTDPDDPASEPRHGFNPLNKPAEHVIRRAFLSSRDTSGAPKRAVRTEPE